MTKLNNNGFAISTTLYGLLIVLILITTLIMSTMSFIRQNNKNFSDTVVKKLEKNKSISYSMRSTCINKAKALSTKNTTCDDMLDIIKQDYFAVCYRTSSNETYCNSELSRRDSDLNDIFTKCNAKIYNMETTVRRGCCLSKSQGNQSTYNSCIN